MRFTRLLWLGVGVALVLLPALPIPAEVGGEVRGPLWAHHVAAWAIGLLVVVTGGLLAGRIATKLELPKGARLRIPPWAVVGALALTLTAAALYVMLGVFAGNPHLVDEIAQLFHARAFAAGRAVEYYTEGGLDLEVIQWAALQQFAQRCLPPIYRSPGYVWYVVRSIAAVQFLGP